MYDMDEYVGKNIDRYLKDTGAKKKLKKVATPFLDESREPMGCTVAEATGDESVLGSTKPEGSLMTGNQGPSLLHGLKQLIPVTRDTWVQLWDELNGGYTLDAVRRSQIL